MNNDLALTEVVKLRRRVERLETLESGLSSIDREREIIVPVSRVTLGASAPTATTRTVGASGAIEVPVLSFSKTTQQDAYFEVHMPGDVDESVNVQFHLMWFPGASWSAGNYMWKLEYLIKAEDGAGIGTGTPTTIEMSVTPADAVTTIETEFTDTIDANAEQILWCHLYRDVANDNADDVGEVRFCEVAYETNVLGETVVDTAAQLLAKLITVDGTGSGLDADLVDGINAASFLRSNANTTQSDGLYIATDEVRARDSGGLALKDDAGTLGIFIEDGGQVGIGMTTPANVLEAYKASADCWINSISDGAQGVISAESYRASAFGSYIVLRTARGTYALPEVSQSGDRVGALLGYGYSAAAGGFLICGSVDIAIDGTPDSGGDPTDMPGRIVFNTTPEGSNARLERMRIDNVGNVKIAGTADRGTTVGTNALHIFNGTAPAGTLTNGCSIYSTSGELYTMDAAGNATLQTPHDEAGNWVFDSVNTVTGRRLRIDMERMLRAINERFGWDFVHEFIEEQ